MSVKIKPSPGTVGLLFYHSNNTLYEAMVIRNDPDPCVGTSMFSIPGLGKGQLYPGVCKDCPDCWFTPYSIFSERYGIVIPEDKFATDIPPEAASCGSGRPQRKMNTLKQTHSNVVRPPSASKQKKPPEPMSWDL
jgi:hypothetical protein